MARPSMLLAPPVQASLVLTWKRGPSLVLARLQPIRWNGGDEETRTPDFLLAKEALYQLSYVPVGVSGLEPEASALSGQCSNHLS